MPAIINSRLDKTLAAIKSLEGVTLLVGVTQDSTKRSDTDFTNAAIAAIAEYGSPANNIPARPVLGPAFARSSAEVRKGFGAALNSVLAGKPGEVEGHFSAVGEAVVKAARRQILMGDHAPLKPATLARRRAKGSMSSLPLYDTQQLYDSYTFVVRGKVAPIDSRNWWQRVAPSWLGGKAAPGF